MFGTSEFMVAADIRRATGDTRSLSFRYARGELVRVRRGIYLDKATWIALKPWQRYARTAAAVSLELGPSRFCYETAALIWGLNLVGVPGHIHLAGASSSHAGVQASTTTAATQKASKSTGLEKIRGYGVFRHAYSPPSVLHRGLNVTTLEQTAVDVMARSSFIKAVVLADHAISPERFKGRPVSEAGLRSIAAQLRSGAKRRWVGRILDFADSRSGSAGESLSRAQMHLLGFPAPELQTTFHDDEGFVARTDFFWRKQKVIGEFDGDAKYLKDEFLNGLSAREAVLAEKKREDRLRALGFTVVRWDWALANNPSLLKRKLENSGLVAVTRQGKIPG